MSAPHLQETATLATCESSATSRNLRMHPKSSLELSTSCWLGMIARWLYSLIQL